MTFEAGDRILQAARLREDDRIVRELSDSDPIAIEVCCHHSCYVWYTKKRSLDTLEKCEGPKAKDLYEEAYTSVVQEFKRDVLSGHKTMSMSILLEHFNTHLAAHDKEAPNYKSYKLKNRFLKTFGEQLSFWQPGKRNESVILFSSAITKGQILEAGL